MIRIPAVSFPGPKLPAHFLWYFLVAASLLFIGFLFALFQGALIYHSVAPLDHAALQARAGFHNQTVMPFMANAYPRLLFLNAGVALFILMVPLFWVWIWWFRRDLLEIVIRVMQGTVCLLMLALGHNSFTKAYLTYKLLSWKMIATLYLPHGWLEMLAFILAGTSALLAIDALQEYLQQNEDPDTLHPGDICLFILGRVWKAGLLVFALMAIAAAIECFVTPVLVEAAFNTALMQA